MLEDLKSTRLGQPQLPDKLPAAIDTFKKLEMSDHNVWRHMDLSSVYTYLRNNRKLKIPAEWRAFVPKSFNEVF